MRTCYLPSIHATETPDGWTTIIGGKPYAAPTIGELAAQIATATLTENDARYKAQAEWAAKLAAMPTVRTVNRDHQKPIEERVLKVTATQIVIASPHESAVAKSRYKRDDATGNYSEMGRDSWERRVILAADAAALTSAKGGAS